MDVQVAIDKLAGLGSAAAIAKFLEEEGVKGWRSNATSCPVANYLRNNTNITGYIGVYCVGAKEVSTDSGWYDLAEPIAEFARSFDAGRYPQLRHK